MLSGFAVRLAGAYNTDNLAYLIASTVLIMSGPPVYALINYCTYFSPNLLNTYTIARNMLAHLRTS